jgi:hypothetical protein
MSKSFDSKRSSKKKPTMTLKEKRLKKHAKKQAREFHEVDQPNIMM